MPRDVKSKRVTGGWLCLLFLLPAVLSVEVCKFIVTKIWFIPNARRQCELQFKTPVANVALEYARSRITRRGGPSDLFPKAAVCTTSEGERGEVKLLLFSLNSTLNDVLGATYFFLSILLSFILALFYYFLWLRIKRRRQALKEQ